MVVKSHLIVPIGPGRFTLRRGDSGHDVAALQIALQVAGYTFIEVDSFFGAAVEAAVKNYQQIKGLKVDGVAGPATQAKICAAQSQAAQKGLPKGMLRSVRGNESSDMLGCRSEHPSDPGYDLGPYQDSIEPQFVHDQSRIRRALNVKIMSKDTALKIRAQYTKYRAWGKVSKRRCWELAVLFHNWPYVADRLAQGKTALATPGADDAPAEWIIKATHGRLQTPRQWIAAYIEKSTRYVIWRRWI